MSILSLTFHCTPEKIKEWEKYVNDTLILMTENLMDVDHYILSEVESDYIQEGKNYNLLLIFDNNDLRKDFMESEMKNIAEHITKEFADQVMIFDTHLNPLKKRLQ